jgi:hypothetical protein
MQCHAGCNVRLLMCAVMCHVQGLLQTCNRGEMKVASGTYMLHSLARYTIATSFRHTKSYYDMHNMLCS